MFLPMKGGNLDGLITFMNVAWGRTIRVVLGVVIAALGIISLGGIGGGLLAVIGGVIIGMGGWGRCLLELTPGRLHSAA